MKVKKAKWLVIMMVMAMLLALVPAMAVADVHGNGQEKIIYGVVGNGSNGSLWKIDPTGGTIDEVKIVDITDVGGATGFYPNGLAFDEDNNRLYYAIRKSTGGTNIYFYDLDTETFATAATGLSGEIYGATWGAGKYWYIPNSSSNIWSVSFDGDGINGVATQFEANFTGVNKSFNFGDIALDAEENVIYVSTSFSGTHKEFFKYDLNEDAGERYELITTTTKAVGLQLGFGTGGVLYGHNTFGEFPAGTKGLTVQPMEWFEVGKGGATTSLGVGENKYNDLSSGPVKEPPTYGFCGYKYVDGEPAEGWEILLEVAVNDGWAKFEKEGLVNPAITGPDGKYCFDGLPAGTYRVTETLQGGYTQVFPDPEGVNGGAYIVVLPGGETPENTILYGTQGQNGSNNGLYKINLDTGEATRLFNTGGSGWSPNALAHDFENGRLYYTRFTEHPTTYVGSSTLYFYDLNAGTETAANLVFGDEVVVGATFYDGAYYYIPNLTADLWKVTFNQDGTAVGKEPVIVNFNGDSEAVYRFGDFAITRNGMLYASTNKTGGSTGEFFKIDLNTEEYTRIAEDGAGKAIQMQVSFGSDGTLYGHASGTGEFFTIDLDTGDVTSIGFVESDVKNKEQFSDLASGIQPYNFYNETDRVKVCETAWAKGATAVPNNEVKYNGTANPSNAWGWTNWFSGDELVMNLYAGAGQNDTTKGKLVGTVTVTCDGDYATVVFQVDEGYWIDEAHLWVGGTPLPLVEVGRNKTPTPTAAPGQFYQNYAYDAADRTATFVIKVDGCEFWVAAHAVVCWWE